MSLRLHLQIIRTIQLAHHTGRNYVTTAITCNKHLFNARSFKDKQILTNLHDPDIFGTLSGKFPSTSSTLEDEADMKEQEFLENIPLQSQKLSTKQYADLIKEYLKHKRLKEAIDVLEVRMIKVDRVKPENYIYNILIGACADLGYTKKAFKLFNDMKKRALKPTGDTYTCLFQACTKCPWPAYGLKHATNLRQLMIEKAIEPNLTNYNSMIKAFGRCGDLTTSFKIVDEMISKKIKIRVHTFNHLLQVCISNRDTGLRQALIIWRKMLSMREKPNIYSFNLMLKCVKDCNLGSMEDIEELITIIGGHVTLIKNYNTDKMLEIESAESNIHIHNQIKNSGSESSVNSTRQIVEPKENNVTQVCKENISKSDESQVVVNMHLVDNHNKPVFKPATSNERFVPNLLSKQLNMSQVMSLKQIRTVQDKFALIGGKEDFLKEMESYGVKPDVKTFSQLLPLLDNNKKTELQLIETMQSLKVRTDIDFYNILIKRRCLRSDYDGAFEVIDMIEKEDNERKRKLPYRNDLRLKVNIMTYGVLAMACKTKDSAENLLQKMDDNHLKVNIEILGTLLRQGTANFKFGYVLHVMNIVKKENIKINEVFMKHLEHFNTICSDIIRKDISNEKRTCADHFKESYKTFLEVYSKWITDVNVEKALQPEHPWHQFKESYPEMIQKDIHIKEPRRFYKRNRKYVKYIPRV